MAQYSISVGTEANNLMFGTNGAQAFVGLGGNDLIWSGRGADLIFGGDGNDWLFGGRGKDTLYGGAGTDMFVFESVKDGRDKIMDFTPGEDFIRIPLVKGFNYGEDGLSLSDNGKRLYYDKDGDGGKDPFLLCSASRRSPESQRSQHWQYSLEQRESRSPAGS